MKIATKHVKFLLFSICWEWVLPKKLIIFAIFLALALSGCAHPPPTRPPETEVASQESDEWYCDPSADAAMKRGDFESGLNQHARFVADHPDNALAHYHLGYAFGQMGNIEQEIAHYETAVSLGYHHNEQLFFNLAMAYGEVRRFDDAIEAFKKVLALDAEADDALFELSGIYREIGDLDRERQTLRRYLNRVPEDEYILNRLDQLNEMQPN